MIERISLAGLSVLRALPSGQGRAASSRPRPTLLFVHGFFVDASVFEPMIPFFASRGYPTFAVSLRGRHGSRPDVDLGSVSMRDFADDAASVARELGVKPIVIGHSMGGLIAQLLGERDAAKGLVLFAPAPPRGISILSLPLMIAQIPYMPSILLSRPVIPRRSDLSKLALNCVPAAEREELFATMIPDSGRAGREMSMTGVTVDPAKVRAPMLVIGGDHDRFIPLSRVARTAARYGARLRVAPGRGHMLVREPGWEELAAWVDEWIIEKGL
jgi:pimeloyl-ACP methyl ester carboxylesterase